ncbi:Transcriptional regulator, TetR family [Labilithrix luteola]|uniref:Transcriptional regulator, TetR family n=1 Tax=Labilithrix luteola TaxID=1391654 RepID=A0A0K1PP38_9BACT|nr:TetR/AcrR family transcriptional regulator [Labilithrix luteola]AKU95300.1 Transcriptional regulator, TetR family [Labilithrix luteola]
MATKAAAARTTEREESSRSARKRKAIVDAATKVFLAGGYLGANVDEIASVSGVSKQTVYKHFENKEALFVEIVTNVSSTASDTVHNEAPELEEGGDVAAYLVDYAYRQLTVVLTPRTMQLRRLVIGEVGRFPELARALYERGPQRALDALAALFGRLTERGVLDVDDPKVAASHFNWLVMSEALNRAMLLGDAAIPKPAELQKHAEAGVRVFLAAYGGARSSAGRPRAVPVRAKKKATQR